MDMSGLEPCMANGSLAMHGAGVQLLEELCGVFSNYEEDHAQETQFSPSFCRNRQLKEWEASFMALLRIKLQEHQPLTRH